VPFSSSTIDNGIDPVPAKTRGLNRICTDFLLDY